MTRDYRSFTPTTSNIQPSVSAPVADWFRLWGRYRGQIGRECGLPLLLAIRELLGWLVRHVIRRADARASFARRQSIQYACLCLVPRLV
jgi:hypothetical protein